MYADGAIRAYLDDLASGKPAPGGGSAAALLGATGASLLCMAGRFTAGRKKYRAVEAEIASILEETEKIRIEMTNLVDLDVQAYDAVTRAYSMPKDTADQKTARSAAIQEALKSALDVPMRICALAHRALRFCPALLAKANPNLASDVGTGALSLAAAYKGALLNVETNLAGLKDGKFVRIRRSEVDPMTAEVEKLAGEVLERAFEAAKGGGA